MRTTNAEKLALALGPEPRFVGDKKEICTLLRREVHKLRQWIGRREAELTRARMELAVTRTRFKELGFGTGPLYQRLEKLEQRHKDSIRDIRANMAVPLSQETEARESPSDGGDYQHCPENDAPSSVRARAEVR